MENSSSDEEPKSPAKKPSRRKPKVVFSEPTSGSQEELVGRPSSVVDGQDGSLPEEGQSDRLDFSSGQENSSEESPAAQLPSSAQDETDSFDPRRSAVLSHDPREHAAEESADARMRFDFVPDLKTSEALEEHQLDPTELREAQSFEEVVDSETDAFNTISQALEEYISSEDGETNIPSFQITDGSELGVQNENYQQYKPEKIGFDHLGSPEELIRLLEKVGYQAQPFVAAQLALLLATKINTVRTIMLEGPSGCGKSFLGKSLAKISGAEFMVLQCYKDMNLENLIEAPSTLALVNAMAGKGDLKAEEAMNLGIISRAFKMSHEKPVILLVDELDKVEGAIDTFFLGPIQDARIYPQSHPPIDANIDNLIIMFTKNMERTLNDALLRRLQPVQMDYMSTDLEKKVLSPHCAPKLIENMLRVADIMRHTDGSYPFERPPAPEELLKTGIYITKLLQWNITNFSFVGKNIWYMLAKSEHDRQVFESLLRYHPDFFDPLVPDGRRATRYQVFARLGRIILKGVVEDPDDERRGKAYRPEAVGLTKVGTPEELARKLGEVGYQCLPFVATQTALLLNTPTDRVRGLLLEGPSGCGKSFLAKCLAKITGADLMCLSCYADMNTSHLIEAPSSLAMAKSMATGEEVAKEKLMNLGVLTRAFLKSQRQPVILLVDELDKVGDHIDTFFLGPLQDARIWLESRPPIDSVLDNLLVIFTKNMNRTIDQALLRRLHPIRMTYLDSTLERKILAKHCVPQLVANLVEVADRMRESNGSYEFERPPAPEELLTTAHYIAQLLEWGERDFASVGRNIWAVLSKSEHDRAVLEHMLRFHPDFEDPLFPDGRGAPLHEIYGRLGRWVLRAIVEDPTEKLREEAWANMEWN